MTDFLPNKPQNVKNDLKAAIAEADDYAGNTPSAWFRAECDFDFDDPVTGHLTHDFTKCPFCRVRRLTRAYGVALHLEGKSHGKETH